MTLVVVTLKFVGYGFFSMLWYVAIETDVPMLNRTLGEIYTDKYIYISLLTPFVSQLHQGNYYILVFTLSPFG